MQVKQRKPVFFGWKVAWSAFIVAIFGWGVGFYGPPVFLHAVVERTGWTLTLVSSAVTVHFLVGVLVVANAPALYRRFGVPTVTLSGAVLLAFGVAGWSLAREPYQLFGAALLSGAGWVTMAAVAMNAIVAPWFDRKRPAALSLAYNGSSLGGVVMSPLWVLLIGALGFPLAAAAVGFAMIGTIGLLCRYTLAQTPESLGLTPDGETAASTAPPPERPCVAGRALFADRAFLTLAAAMALGLFGQIGLIAHLFTVLVTPFGAERAGLLMGAATLSALVGRTLTGILLPPGMNRRTAASLSYAVQMLGGVLLILSGGTAPLPLIAGVLLFGFGIGNATSLPPLIAQQEFAKFEVQRVVSLIVAGAQTAFAFAPAAYAAVHSLVSGTSPVTFFVMAVACQGLAILCMLLGRGRSSRKAEFAAVSR